MPRRSANCVLEQIRVGLPHHRAPNFARVVHFGVGIARKWGRRRQWQRDAVANVPERQSVLLEVCRVRVTTNAVIAAVLELLGSINARGKRSAEIVIRTEHLHQRDKVTPTFAHCAELLGAAGRNAHVQVMAPLMRYDPVVDGPVTGDGDSSARCKDVHLHAWRIAIGRRGHIRIVRAARVLRFGVKDVAFDPTTTEVHGLRVTRCFVEARVVPEIVRVVVIEEQLRNRRLALRVARRGLRRVVYAIKRPGTRRTRAEIRSGKTIGRVQIDIRIDVVAHRRCRACRQPRIERHHRVRIEPVHRHERRHRIEHGIRVIRHARRMRREIIQRTIRRRVRRRIVTPDAILECRFLRQTLALEQAPIVRRNDIRIKHRRTRLLARPKLDVICRHEVLGHREIHLLDAGRTRQTNFLERCFRRAIELVERISMLWALQIRERRRRDVRLEIVIKRFRNRFFRGKTEGGRAGDHRSRCRMQIAGDRHKLHRRRHQDLERRIVHVEAIRLLLVDDDDPALAGIVNLRDVRRIEGTLRQTIQRSIMVQVKLRSRLGTRHERTARCDDPIGRSPVHRGHSALVVYACNARQKLLGRSFVCQRTRNRSGVTICVVVRKSILVRVGK